MKTKTNKSGKGKVVAYMVMYKPTACKCWTPAFGPRFRELSANWFWRSASAKRAAHELNMKEMRRYLKGLKQWDTLEFTVAKVELIGK